MFFDCDKPVKWCHCLLELERETEIHGKHTNILFVVSKVNTIMRTHFQKLILQHRQTSLTTLQTNDQHYGLKTPYKRCPFPSPWRGLAEAELEAASGVAGASLVHQGGYVAYTSTREAALQVSSFTSHIGCFSFRGVSSPHLGCLFTVF